MYERFTDRARKVMQFANQEAQRFNHEYIGTEHILLGLVKEGSGCHATVFDALDIDLAKVRMEVEKRTQCGSDFVTVGKLPQTPRVKKVIEYAIEGARKLGQNYVGTEHILLGLTKDNEGVAGQILHELGLTEEFALAACTKNGGSISKAIYELLCQKKEEAVENQDFQLAMHYRDKTNRLKKKFPETNQTEVKMKEGGDDPADVAKIRKIGCALFLWFSGELEASQALNEIRSVLG